MKKPHLMLLLVAALALLAVPASAFNLNVDYTESIQDYGIDASGYNYISSVDFSNGYIGWMQTESWGHTLSSSYMPVPDDVTVANATLRISGYRYLGFGMDAVNVGGEFRWTQYEGWTWRTDYTENLFDITNIDASYWNSDPLSVSMTPVFDHGLVLTSSILAVDYDRATGTGSGGGLAAVPEPATLTLLGLGLLGGGILRYRRKRS
ncbi:MAG: PEP-CTERM sorting domain-containing protein [candidate division Zixibacteria bacterium]|nr:PEP-CTERM sorting domain-containing protein [candidate division Zixibacteria bacterium]